MSGFKVRVQNGDFWCAEDRQGNREDEVFPTLTAAEEAITEFLEDTAEAYSNGLLDEPYNPNQIEIVEVTT